MVNLLKLAELVEKVSHSFEKLTVNSALCSKTHSALSKCSRCIDVCPVQAINIHHDSIQIDHCIECGLCARLCPTGALKWNSPSDLFVMEQVKQFEQYKELIYVHCSFHKLAGKPTNQIEVPCLAAILPEIWLAMLHSQTQFTIYLPKGACQNCSVLSGGELLSKDLAEVERLTGRKMNRIHSVDECQAKVIDKGMDQDRRDSISYMMKMVKKAPLIAIRDWAGNGTEKNQEQNKISPIVSPRKEVLYYLCKNQAELQPFITLKLPVINEKCEFCNACSILCPNKALNQVEKNQATEIRVDPLLCSECNLCQDICYFGAIELKETNIHINEVQYLKLASKPIE